MTTLCVDCGVEVALGKRGPITKRCGECKRKHQLATHKGMPAEYYTERRRKAGIKARKPRVVLADDQVAEIAVRVVRGEAQYALAKEYGVTQSTISRLLSGENRGSLTLVSRNSVCPECGSVYHQTRRNMHHCGSKECWAKVIARRNQAYAAKFNSPTLKQRSYRLVLEAKDKPCVDCGVYYPGEPELMSLDHRDPGSKHVRLKGKRNGNIRGLPVDEAIAELLKCDAVCLICHARRTRIQHRQGKISTAAKRHPKRTRAVATVERGTLFAAVASR